MSQWGRNQVNGVVDGSIVQAQAVHGGVHVWPSGFRRVPPRQLPARPASFVGRKPELLALDNALKSTRVSNEMLIAAIVGTGGAGKTALGLRWCHENISDFPDGQLYVNLHGFDPSGSPIHWSVAVRGFLDALGVVPGAIPDELEAQVGLYRSLVADRQMLIFLDNAVNSAQVEFLMPGSSSCTVLVTSRSHLTGLITTHNVLPLQVDVLDRTEARDLLVRRLGPERISREPMAVESLLVSCSGLPLALAIVVSRALTQPRSHLATLASELRETTDRLAEFEEGDLNACVRTAFSWSYAALLDDQAQLFRFLGVVQGQDIDVFAVASLIGRPVKEAKYRLRQLEQVSLVQQDESGRWRMHDLIKLYAVDRSVAQDSEEAQNGALFRLVSFYLHAAFVADALLYPHSSSIEIDTLACDRKVPKIEDEFAALRWFDKEHRQILAAQKVAFEQSWWRASWQLAWTLDSFHFRRGHRRDHLATWKVGLDAAKKLNDPGLVSFANRLLGCAFSRLGEHAEALDKLYEALHCSSHRRDEYNTSNSHLALAQAWERKGEYRKALIHSSRALSQFRTLEDPMREGDTLRIIGFSHARIRQFGKAQYYCQEALLLCRGHSYLAGEAHALKDLGYIALETGDHILGRDQYAQGVNLFRKIGDTYEEASALECLGMAYLGLGCNNEAINLLWRAHELYRMQHRVVDAERLTPYSRGPQETGC